MEHFTPYSATAGGMLIGLAAVVLMAFHGRIAGISGIVGGLLTPRAGDVAWRTAFVIGMIAAAAALAAAGFAPALRERPGPRPHRHRRPARRLRHAPRLAAAPAVTACAVSRGCRTRSLAATLVFMASAAAVVFVARHVLGA